MGLQHAADDGMTEGRVIHIGVTADIDKIQLLYPAFLHICPGNRKKVRTKV